MSKTASASRVAASLCVESRSVQRRANRENWPYLNRRGRGGNSKRYIIKHLPEAVRTALARHLSKNSVTTITEASAAGARAGEQLVQDQAKNAERQRIIKEQQLAAFARLLPGKQDVAYARREVLRAVDAYLLATGISNRKKGTVTFCALFNAGEVTLPDSVRNHIEKTSASTLQRWQRVLKNNGMIGLANGYRNPKKGTTTLPQDQQDFIVAMLYKKPHSSFTSLDMALMARFPQPPHPSTTRRYVTSWKDKNASLYLYMTNPDAWRNKYQFAIGDASEHVERVNHVWEFDSTPADVMLADGRHNIIGVIDVYTRRFKMLVSKSSKSTAVAALLRSGVLSWGVPEIAKTDNGADYVSRHIVHALEHLGVEQILCPPFTPECKPHIERVFKTFSHSFAELMPGYIGHCVADRKDIESRKSFAARLGNKDTTVDINMTAEELQQYCDRWCEAIYHQTAHSGLDKKSPAEVARAWDGTEKRITDVRALDILLAESPQGDGFRVVTKKGLSVNRINYISDGLAGLEGKKVRIKLDPADLGTIYLFGEDGKFITIAVDPLRKGIDRAEMAAKLLARQKELIRVGNKQVRKVAKVQAVEEIHEEILGFYEGKLANVIELPKRSEEYTTDALNEAAKAVAANDNELRGDQAADDVMVDECFQSPPPAPAKEPDSKIVVMVSDGDMYQDIKSRERTTSLTEVEAVFLDDFYQTRSGRMYLELEGDLRTTLGRMRNEARKGQ